jgi:hypothetical protein
MSVFLLKGRKAKASEADLIAQVESSGIVGTIPVPENCTCLNALKLSDPGR